MTQTARAADAKKAWDVLSEHALAAADAWAEYESLAGGPHAENLYNAAVAACYRANKAARNATRATGAAIVEAAAELASKPTVA